MHARGQPESRAPARAGPPRTRLRRRSAYSRSGSSPLTAAIASSTAAWPLLAMRWPTESDEGRRSRRTPPAGTGSPAPTSPLLITCSRSGATYPVRRRATAPDTAITRRRVRRGLRRRAPPRRRRRAAPRLTSAPWTVTTYGTPRARARRCPAAPSGSAWCACTSVDALAAQAGQLAPHAEVVQVARAREEQPPRQHRHARVARPARRRGRPTRGVWPRRRICGLRHSRRGATAVGEIDAHAGAGLLAAPAPARARTGAGRSPATDTGARPRGPSRPSLPCARLAARPACPCAGASRRHPVEQAARRAVSAPASHSATTAASRPGSPPDRAAAHELGQRSGHVRLRGDPGAVPRRAPAAAGRPSRAA